MKFIPQHRLNFPLRPQQVSLVMPITCPLHSSPHHPELLCREHESLLRLDNQLFPETFAAQGRDFAPVRYSPWQQVNALMRDAPWRDPVAASGVA